jgi:hypothetical protein
MSGRVPLLVIWLVLLSLVPSSAAAVEFKAQSSTQYLWYKDPFLDQNESDVVQYLKFSAMKIDSAGRLSAVGYGRVSKQFGADENIALGNSDDVLGRLYFLYLNYDLPGERGSVRLGRQFVVVGAGSGTIDGGRIVVRNLGPVTISVFGGYEVRFAETTDRTASGNYLTGVSAGGSLFTGNNLELSYLRKYGDGDVVREMAGVHVDQTVFAKIKGYADLRYDLIHEAYGEFLAGVKVFPYEERMITFTAEYYSSYPNFDADSVFTVFGVTRYQQYVGRVDWIVNPGLTLYGSYTRADYDGPNADVGTIGVRYRPKRVAGLGINASADIRRGYPGKLTGGRISADYAFKKAIVSAGVAYDNFQRDSMTESFNAKQYWVAGTYEFRKNLTARLRVEDAATRLFSNEVQGRASVEMSF